MGINMSCLSRGTTAVHRCCHLLLLTDTSMHAVPCLWRLSHAIFQLEQLAPCSIGSPHQHSGLYEYCVAWFPVCGGSHTPFLHQNGFWLLLHARILARDLGLCESTATLLWTAPPVQVQRFLVPMPHRPLLFHSSSLSCRPAGSTNYGTGASRCGWKLGRLICDFTLPTYLWNVVGSSNHVFQLEKLYV